MIILGTNSIKDTGYDVANSCRFDRASSDGLTRSQSTGNQRTYTVSFWVKRSALGNQEHIVSARYGNQTRYQYIRWNGDSDSKKNCLDIFSGIYSTSSTSTSMYFVTNRVFRDMSAWYHIVLAVDTTQSTESNRVKIYINGVQETSFQQSTYPTQNQQHFYNINTTSIEIGTQNSGQYLNSYLAEVVLVDGQQLDATSFGEFDSDSGIWKPIDVSGLTFGTNGFYLDFEDSSALGNDANGSNNFTVNNLTAIDQSTDTCTNNFATLNVLDGNLGNSTFSEGSLRFNSEDGANKCWMRSTIGVSSGKWYFEAKVQTAGNNCAIGISDRPSPDFNSTELGAGAFDYSYQSANSGNKLNNGSGSSYGDTYTDDDIVSCALDLDNNKVYFGKNGTFQNSGNPTNGTNPAFTITAPSLTNHGFYFFCLGDLTGVNNVRWLANFGSPPYSESGGNSDGNGYGNFAGSVPSGYYALNTKNLAEYG